MLKLYQCKMFILVLLALLSHYNVINGACNNYVNKKASPTDLDIMNGIKVMPRLIKIDVDVFVHHLLKENLEARNMDPVEYVDNVFHFAGRVGVWHNILYKVRKVTFLTPNHQLKINMSSLYKTHFLVSSYFKSLTNRGDIGALLADIPGHMYIPNDGNYIGFGDLGYHCIHGVSVNQAGASIYYDPAYAGQLLAHEMGHNIGMPDLYSIPHGCTCLRSSLNCVMHTAHARWNKNMKYFAYYSTCSIDSAIESMKTAKGNCLYEFMDSEHKSSSFCGNGLVDEGEDCDCGDEYSCQTNGGDMCCTASCKFKNPSFQCFRGDCCDQCMFKKKTICRAENGPCDIPEFCDGTIDECPKDYYKEDGLSCGSNAYCFDGKCPTEENSCDVYFPGKNVYHSTECEELLNVEIKNGCKRFYSQVDVYHQLCGSNKIAGECGRLYCVGDVGTHNMIYPVQLNGRNGPITCNIMGPYYSVNSGAKPDGYGCSSRGDICYNQVCTPASTFTNKCPNCPANTVCSSKGTCRPSSIRYFENRREYEQEQNTPIKVNEKVKVNEKAKVIYQDNNQNTRTDNKTGSNCFNLKLGNLGSRKVCLDINIF